MSKGNNFGEVYDEAHEIRSGAINLRAERKEKGESKKEDCEKAERLLQKNRDNQEGDDNVRIAEIKEKLSAINWKEFWKNEELESPARNDVFPNGEDAGMSDEEVVKSLNGYFEKQKSDLFNMTGIDSEEFPEIIDRDIRLACQKLNELPFLKTREGCGGHEVDRNGERSNIAYSEPYLTFYAQEENSKFCKLKEQLDNNLEQFGKADLPGIKNVVLSSRKEDWPIKTKGVGMYRYDMRIVPTKEWCDEHNKEYIERPESLGSYPDWCQENGLEYSQDEESASRQKWDEAKKKYWKAVEQFGNEYGEYFRSDEARNLRDEFFKVFEVDVISKEEVVINKEQDQKKRIQEIEQLNLGGIQKAEMVLVLLGAKKATDIMAYKWNDSPAEIKTVLEKNGLCVAEVLRGKTNENLLAEFAVALDKETAEKLANLNPEIDHDEFGRMMGFPESAIEAFGNSKTLAREKYPNIQGLIFKFILSENHWQEEVEVMRNWTKLIKDNAPELYRELSVRGS